jgi:hypothetical protein
MPLIRSRHSDILPEASMMILGSVALGIDDELSDVEAVIYLPDEIWKKNGLLQIDLDKCLAETNLWQQGGSIICVHPLSWMFSGKGEKILSEGNVSWEDLEFESLFEIQNNPVYHDPQDRLGRLRRMTVPEKMPEILWKKALLSKLNNFVGDGIHEMRKCVDRRHFLDAYIPLGDAVKALLDIGFMICHQYYPYRKHLRWAFGKLPSQISVLSSHFDLLSVTTDWQGRFSLMETIFNEYREYIISKSLLPELDFNRIDLYDMPLHDNEFYIARNILNNPNWRAEQDAIMEKTLKLGFEPEASRWVGWWEIE